MHQSSPHLKRLKIHFSVPTLSASFQEKQSLQGCFVRFIPWPARLLAPLRRPPLVSECQGLLLKNFSAFGHPPTSRLNLAERTDNSQDRTLTLWIRSILDCQKTKVWSLILTDTLFNSFTLFALTSDLKIVLVSFNSKVQYLIMEESYNKDQEFNTGKVNDEKPDKADNTWRSYLGLFDVRVLRTHPAIKPMRSVPNNRIILDMESFQKNTRTSTTWVFCSKKTTTRVIKTKIMMFFGFIFLPL